MERPNEFGNYLRSYMKFIHFVCMAKRKKEWRVGGDMDKFTSGKEKYKSQIMVSAWAG